ncbi:probable inactive histone-lysine N-methyltransferase SUVR2 isoform X3 [Brachypodium distachyon]|uniref:SET domain-containing protein n=2 Tax=Brachypodium distachyon TaxID=15368 RepID=A0A2K2D487_BRADI|nr:probable inactive histone-lysine N-methyltransferase SUVR2 isoform X3 [Brachypodium distachyon]PNT69085.1 hypothetical protein BRADI_3g48970v3 [Brachypodium distachyon]|eukprot:XP_024317955.1 probable inactive histone-lysine N-methyltransferase SUVR2 isoform X3 [Brachypodium distachyon]
MPCFSLSDNSDKPLFLPRRMVPSKVSLERFEAAVTSMHAIGIQSETVTPVLENLLKLYDYNWEYIEADNFRVLTDAIFDDPDPKEEHKTQANKRTNLDSNHYKKKLRIKHHYDSRTSKMNVHNRRELAEAPVQEVGKLCPQIVCEGKITRSKSRLLIKEQNMEIKVPEDTQTDEDSSHHGGYKDALTISGLPHADKEAFVAHGRNMSDACCSPAITSNKGFSTNFDVASSKSGTGKLSFTYNSSLAHHPDFQVPDMELVCKEMDARCLRKFKILEPNFSFMKLLEDTCQCIVDMGCESSGPRERGIVQIVPAIDYLSKPSVPRELQSNQAGSPCMPPNNHMILGGIHSSSAVPKVPHHDVNDITKGEERLSIPIVNETGNGILPPPFHYIPRNIAFQNAYIDLSLARIGDESCCSDCYGDCLAQPLPCACATETGGEFAYTRDGLLKEGFLDFCVSMIQEPDKHHLYRCKDCPYERLKTETNSNSSNTKVNPGPCKGHLIRKFIKECWSKCGCTKNCGNRVVQRGITQHLQVFLTSGDKGWGLRAAEELPRGAFICESVGEILTNTELYERTNQKTTESRHKYPVLLDADWVTESVLEDDHALCLDATFYGNVARFINHRTMELIFTMSTTLSRLSNVSVGANIAATHQASQDLNPERRCYYECCR